MAELVATIIATLFLEFLKAIIWVSTAVAFYLMIQGRD